jgi:hypothetical protein
MRVLGVCLIAALLLASAGCQAVESARRFSPPEPAPEEIASDSGIPADDPALPREDSVNRTPEGAVLLLVQKLNERDWDAAYSLYATPSVDPTTAAREWADAGETYSRFTVLETRVVDEELAYVRVTYGVASDLGAETSVNFTVSEPGEWWPLHKVAGVWKTQWMPRQ